MTEEINWNSILNMDWLEFNIWVNSKWKEVLFDLVSNPHIMAAWSTWSWKSVAVNKIILDIITNFNPDQAKIDLIDPKQVEFWDYEWVPHLEHEIVFWMKEDSIKKWLKLIDSFKDEMEYRYELFKENWVKHLISYNKLWKWILPWKFLVIDELASYKDAMNKKDYDEFMRNLWITLAMARAAWMYVILATQKPSTDVIPSTLRSNVTTKICFTTDNWNQTNAVLWHNSIDAHLFTRKWHWYVESWTTKEEIRAYYVKEDEIKRVIKIIKDKYKDYDSSTKEIEVNSDEDSNEETIEDYSNEEFQVLSKFKDQINDITDSLLSCFEDNWKISKQLIHWYLRENWVDISLPDTQILLEETDNLNITAKKTSNSPRHLLLETEKLISNKFEEMLKN